MKPPKCKHCNRAMKLIAVQGISNVGWWYFCKTHGYKFIGNLPKGRRPK